MADRLGNGIYWDYNKIQFFWLGCFTMYGLSPKGVDDIFKWCEENLPNRTKIFNWGHNQWDGHMKKIIFSEQLQAGNLRIFVKSKEDAIAFKLRWL